MPKLVFNPTTAKLDMVNDGDVVGPVSNTADYIPQWDGANSKTLKDGVAIPAGGLAGITALNDKAPIASPTFTGTVNGITAAMVGAPSGSGTSSGTNTGDQPIATGSTLDTGTNNTDIATAKALKDSHNVPSVAPGTSGNVLTSDGTDWTSAAPSTSSGSYLVQAFTSQTSVSVAHNFGSYPAVQVIDDTGAVIIPLTITNTSVNGLTVTFSGATTGNIIVTAGGPVATYRTEYDNGDSGTTKTIDWLNGSLQKVTMTGNCKFTFTLPATGQGFMQLRAIQDTTGSRLLDEIVLATTTFATTDVDTTAETITLNIDIPNLSRIRFSSSTTVPAPLVAGTIYWAIRVNATTIKVATTYALAQAGTNINLSSQGTGTHTIERLVKYSDGVRPILSTGKETQDILTFFTDGTMCVCGNSGSLNYI